MSPEVVATLIRILPSVFLGSDLAGAKCSAADILDREQMIKQPDPTPQGGTQGAGDAWTESSKYLAYVFVGVLVFGIPWYLADEVVFKPGSKPYYGLSIACYVLAFVCVGCGGWAFLRHQANHNLSPGGKPKISDVRPLLLRRGEEA
jgi:hypothetical protein